MSYLKKAADMLFETKVKTGITTFRVMEPNLIVMSRETASQILREDRNRSFDRAIVRTEPDRLFMARVVYDETMGLGQMAVAEAKGDWT